MEGRRKQLCFGGVSFWGRSKLWLGNLSWRRQTNSGRRRWLPSEKLSRFQQQLKGNRTNSCCKRLFLPVNTNSERWSSSSPKQTLARRCCCPRTNSCSKILVRWGKQISSKARVCFSQPEQTPSGVELRETNSTMGFVSTLFCA